MDFLLAYCWCCDSCGLPETLHAKQIRTSVAKSVFYTFQYRKFQFRHLRKPHLKTSFTENNAVFDVCMVSVFWAKYFQIEQNETF